MRNKIREQGFGTKQERARIPNILWITHAGHTTQVAKRRADKGFPVVGGSQQQGHRLPASGADMPPVDGSRLIPICHADRRRVDPASTPCSVRQRLKAWTPGLVPGVTVRVCLKVIPPHPRGGKPYAASASCWATSRASSAAIHTASASARARSPSAFTRVRRATSSCGP